MTSRALFAAVCDEMIAAWRTVGVPPKVPLGDGSRSALSDIGAVGVIWGWTARVVRLAEAALVLDREGFDTEISPIIRSMLEHAIALPWAIDQRGRAYQALARQRANQMETFKEAQTPDWTLSGESADMLDRAIKIETDDETITEDTYWATYHRAQRYGLGGLYQAWLVETWPTHATFASAAGYSDISAAERTGRLSRYAEPSGRTVASAVAIALHAALTFYSSFDPSAFGDRPDTWKTELDAAMDQFRRERAT